MGGANCHTQYQSPASPADKGMFALMSRILENAEKDEPSRHRSIQDAQEDDRGDHEREGDLLVQRNQRSKGRRSDVLVADECIRDCTDDTEYNDFQDSACPESLGEIPRFAHFGNETGKGDLSDKRIAVCHR